MGAGAGFFVGLAVGAVVGAGVGAGVGAAQKSLPTTVLVRRDRSGAFPWSSV